MRKIIYEKAYGYLIKRDFKIVDLEYKNNTNEIQIKAGHDAYMNIFGCLHNRTLGIDKINNKIYGRDDLSRKNIKSEIKYDIRFHLYPGLAAVQTIGGNTLLIQINKK